MTTNTAHKTGAVGTGQKQHVDLFRKILLRRKLLAYAVKGAAYVPFIVDGDIAAELYADRLIYGADLDEKRVMTARKRFKQCQIIQADCNGWPFPSVTTKFAVADFDAYSDPYAGFRAFWAGSRKADRFVVFFTDGHRQGIIRTHHWHKPDGSKVKLETTNEARAVFNSYFARHVQPWFVGFIGEDWRVLRSMSYTRGGSMLYWGAVIERV